MAILSNRKIAGGAGASQPAGDIAVTAVALLVRCAEFASLARPILRDATGAGPVVTTLGGAFAMRRTVRSERSVASGTLTGDLSACDGAETGAALLVRGAEIVRFASPVLRHTTRRWPVVATLGGAFGMRQTTRSERSIAGGAFAGDLSACDGAETGAALLVRGAEIVRFASPVLRHTTRRWPVVAALGAALLMRYALLAKRSIISRTFAGIGARRNVAEACAALLVRGTEFPAVASPVLRHTTRRWPVVAALGATLLMRGARRPERFRRL